MFDDAWTSKEDDMKIIDVHGNEIDWQKPKHYSEHYVPEAEDVMRQEMQKAMDKELEAPSQASAAARIPSRWQRLFGLR